MSGRCGLWLCQCIHVARKRRFFQGASLPDPARLLSSIALLLAAVGLYSVMAYSVARRTNEIGIRMALGAKRPDVLRLIVRESFSLAVPGLILGCVLASALARLVSTSLVRVSPSNPVIYGAAALFTLLITLFAAAAPALRAARVDPMAALRWE